MIEVFKKIYFFILKNFFFKNSAKTQDNSKTRLSYLGLSYTEVFI
jgi:hypothetical protein